MTVTQARRAPRRESGVLGSRVREPRESGVGMATGRSAFAVPDPLELLQLLQGYVAETAELLPAAPSGLRERTYELLELADDLEIWLIHWPQDRGIELHDHGGSAGALWVVRGTLEEQSIEAEGRLSRRMPAGSGAAFAPSYVHDVVNTSTEPATSVHAYSPPMSHMTFYRQEATGLEVDRLEQRCEPSWTP